MKIDKRGAWQGLDCDKFHVHDSALCSAIFNFLDKKKCSSLADVGCGEGKYVKYFMSKGLNAEGFDGNLKTKEISKGLCSTFDFSKPAKKFKKYDWVLSLEVGEHIPREYESVFMQNLNQLNTKGMILSWAVEGQSGKGHYNCRNNSYIIEKFVSMGYKYCEKDSMHLRQSSKAKWFKNTIMVFEKLNH